MQGVTSGFGGSLRRRYGGAMSGGTGSDHRRWHFLTHHSRVLLAVHRDPEIKLAALASEVGITPRATQHLLRDLERDGAISRIRVGRRNHYEVHLDALAPSEIGSSVTLGNVLGRLSA